MIKLLLPVLCLLTAGWAVPVPFPHRHMVLSVVPTTRAHMELLKTTEETDYELDFWTHPRLNRYTDIMVPWERYNELRQKWIDAGMQVKIMQEDVEALIMNVENENKRLKEERVLPRVGTTLDHSYYRSYNEIEQAIIQLKNTFPNLVRFDENGESPPLPLTVEGRPIIHFEMGAKGDEDDDDEEEDEDHRPVIFFEVMIHAREWITGAANLYAIDWLLTNYGTDADATFMLDNFLFVIMPAANPDGYEFSRSSSNNRLWRKNRRQIGGAFNCYGVDLNRNFDAFWQGSGSCTSITYPGPTYDSEPETQAVQALFKHYKKNMAVYLAVHAYSQIILLPWSYRNTAEVKDTKHKEMGKEMATAMSRVYERSFTFGTPAGTLGYGAGGTTPDWALEMMKDERPDDDKKGFKAIAYELRPGPGSGNSGFILDVTHIVPAGREFQESLVALCWRYMRDQDDD